jgi:hypothetical protein
MLTNTLNGGKSGSDEGMVKTLGALPQIASSVRGVPGRKNVIWVGTGYRNASDLNNLSNVDNDNVKAAIQMVTNRMLAAAHATLYLIDPEGMIARDPGSPDALGNGMPGDPATGYGAYSPGLGFENFVSTTGGRILASAMTLMRRSGRRLQKARSTTLCRMCPRVGTMSLRRTGRSA